jgi:GTP cyclohydrolase II
MPIATIRTQVLIPLRFSDGYTTAARVFTFDGLTDGGQHLAVGLGDRAHAVSRASAVPLVRVHSERLTGVSWAASAATAVPSCEKRSS